MREIARHAPAGVAQGGQRRGVQLRAPGRADHVDDGLADEHVGEPITTLSRCITNEHAGLNRGFKVLDHGERAAMQSGRQCCVPEVASKDGRHLQCGPGRCRQHGHPGAHELQHARGNLIAAPEENEPHHLGKEQRVASASCPQFSRHLLSCGDALAPQPFGDVAYVEAGQRQRDGSSRGGNSGYHGFPQAVGGFLVAIGDDQSQRRWPDLIGDKSQQPQGHLIGPVNIIQHDEQR